MESTEAKGKSTNGERMEETLTKAIEDLDYLRKTLEARHEALSAVELCKKLGKEPGVITEEFLTALEVLYQKLANNEVTQFTDSIRTVLINTYRLINENKVYRDRFAYAMSNFLSAQLKNVKQNSSGAWAGRR